MWWEGLNLCYLSTIWSDGPQYKVIAVLKSRFGKDGVIFEDCTFDNGRVYIDTETSDTFLGYEKKAEVRKEENSRERLKMANLRRQQRNTEQKEVNQ